MLIHLQKELERLEKSILHLGASVEDRIDLAAGAVESGKISNCKLIIKTNYLLDKKRIEIEEECLKIIRLYQPIDIDLRFIVTAIKINSELEHISDETVNIAWRMKASPIRKNKSHIIHDYSSMIENIKTMLKKSLDSFVNMDIDEASKILNIGNKVDIHYYEKYENFKSEMKKFPDHTEYLADMLLVSLHLKRIKDHIGNIANQVIYFIEGEIVHHEKYLG